MQNLALDRIDLRLLAALQEHGRASNLELAAAIKLSPAQTLRRHRRLEEIGVIKRYETRLDAESLGFGVVAFIQVTMGAGPYSRPAEIQGARHQAPAGAGMFFRDG